MNRTYKSIWNEALGAWVAASEVTRSRGKQSKRAAFLTMGAALLLSSGAANAACDFSLSGGSTNFRLSATAPDTVDTCMEGMSSAAAKFHYLSVNGGTTKQANYDNDGAVASNSVAIGPVASTSATLNRPGFRGGWLV